MADLESEIDALEQRVSDADTEPIGLSYALLKLITNNFSNVIGRGGFGVVYMGVLKKARVAVKKLSNELDFNDKLFSDEINCVIEAKHKNIVRLVGYCAETQGELMKIDGRYILADRQKRFLCFEYIPNGDLHKYLQGTSGGVEWTIRYEIIKGICQGLEYLHSLCINHLDLKPENVLLDANMEPKITDFGLSRHLGEGESKIYTMRIIGTPGWMAPEVINHGEISSKADIFGLGKIIIQLLTGHHKFDNINWHKSLNAECPKMKVCIEIARRCVDLDKRNRPDVGEILRILHEVERNIQESKGAVSSISQATKSTSNELIEFDPPELRFFSVPNKRMPMVCIMKIVNVTDHRVGFNTWSLKRNMSRYITTPSSGILPPHSTQVIEVKRISKENEPEDVQCKDVYGVWNGFVNEGVAVSDLDGNMDDDESKLLPIVFTKVSLSISNELIQFDPPQLRFLSVPGKTVPMVCLMKIVNTTDHKVGFNIWCLNKNQSWYVRSPNSGILPPHCTQVIKVKRTAKENEPEDMQFEDVFGVWKGFVSDGVEVSNLGDKRNDDESKLLPIAFTKATLSTSNEVIQFDPPQLRFLYAPDTRVPMVCLMKIVNTTDHRVGFNTWSYRKNLSWYVTTPTRGILPPHSTQVIEVKRTAKENEPADMQCEDVFGVWNGFVTEDVAVSDLSGNMDEDESKLLPIVLTKARGLSTSKELIQFDPPQLRFLSVPDKRVPMVCLMKVVNATNHRVGFNTWFPNKNSSEYITTPSKGILPPRSTQVIKVKRIAKENELADMQCKDEFGVWNGFVSQDVAIGDLTDKTDDDESKLFPIVFSKASLSTSNELIQFDPPQLRFPTFMRDKRRPMLRVKIVNTTDYIVGFNTWCHKENLAWYQVQPDVGILPPQSTKVIKVKRIARENEPEDMQCEDKIGVWYGFVTEGVTASNIHDFVVRDESKLLPIVLTKPGESSSM